MLKKSVNHPLKPIWNQHSKILILGSFPSIQSRKAAFYYGHPQNRFWPLLAKLYQEEIPTTPEEKTNLLLRHGIALWDVIASCAITGSADSSIEKAVPNDIAPLIENSAIKAIYTNGRKAEELYNKLILPHTGLQAIALPSTSPANRRYSLADLAQHWQQITKATTT